MLNNITEFKKEKDLDKAIEIMIDKLSDLQKNYHLTTNEATMILLAATVISTK